MKKFGSLAEAFDDYATRVIGVDRHGQPLQIPPAQMRILRSVFMAGAASVGAMSDPVAAADEVDAYFRRTK